MQRLTSGVEAVEKVSRQIPRRDTEKSDLRQCATINDLMLAKDSNDPRKDRFHSSKGLFLQARCASNLIDRIQAMGYTLYNLGRDPYGYKSSEMGEQSGAPSC